MKTDDNSYLKREKNSNHQNKKIDSSTPKSVSHSKNKNSQKSILEIGKDKDFNELFPKLKSAENEYLKKKNISKKPTLTLIAILIVVSLILIWIANR